MIEITKAYKTEDGQTFSNIQEAQHHELDCLVGGAASEEAKRVVRGIVENPDKVIAILKLKPRKPRTSRAKKAKPVVALAK